MYTLHDVVDALGFEETVSALYEKAGGYFFRSPSTGEFLEGGPVSWDEVWSDLEKSL